MALADAALADAESERSARRRIETENAMWRVATGRGGRGGRGRCGPPPPQPQQPPQPPRPPPLAELIQLVLAAPIEREGDMSEEEALAILNVTNKSPKWLLLQLRPDKHPHHQAQAQAATSRVNQARDVRSRHVTDWTQ